MIYLLHISQDGREWTVPFDSPFLRGLWIITLAAQPVTLRTEDRS